MRVLVNNQYFHPDRSATATLLTELCEDLSRSHEVRVVAGRPSYNPAEHAGSRGMLSRERYGEVEVTRAWSTSFDRASMLGRLANYGTYLATSTVGSLRGPRPDVVLAQTDPPPVGVVASLAARRHDAPFVLVTQDVFPEAAVRLGLIRSPAMIRALRRTASSLFRQAARVVAIGRDMQRRLVAMGVPESKIAVIPNWADGQTIRPGDGPSPVRGMRGWADRFVVMHSGNVGLSQDLDTLLDAAEILRGEPDVVIAIVGEGVARSRLEREAARRGLENVEFHEYAPRTTLSESLGAADIHLISLARGLAGYVVPSKLYGIMAAGKPFIAAMEEGAEPALVARDEGCGLVTPPGDPDALAAAILRAREELLDDMGSRARKAFEERYDRPIATERYRNLLEEVAGARPEV